MKKPIFLSILLLFVLCGIDLSWKARFFPFESGLRLSYAQSSPMNSPRPTIDSPSEEGTFAVDPNGEKGMGRGMGSMGPEGMRESMKDIFSPREVPFYREKTFLIAITVAVMLLIFWVVKRRASRPWGISKKQGTFIHEAILVVDLCESTKMAVTQGDVFAMRIKNKMKACVREVAQDFGATSLENIGDGYLVTFPTGADAVRAAVKILQNAEEYNKTVPEKEKIDLRIGLNYGEMVLDERGGRHGAALNKVFRIEGITKEQQQNLGEGIKPEEFLDKNRIFISEEIKEEIKDMGDIPVQLVGIFDLKGFTGLHRIYYIPWKESAFEKQSL
jgi:class 3 adenylate cyclase